MAHELEILNGEAQMAYVGDVPWHGLGKRVPADLSPDQFMVTAGLDWTVSKETMTTDSGIVVPGKKALVRSLDNKVLDVVGSNWNPVQNAEAFEFFDEYVRAGTNPHKFGKSIDIRMTPIRVVCNNTLTLSLNKNSEQMVTVNHRKAFDPDEVKEQMGIAREKMEQYKSMAEFLGSKRYTGDNLTQYFNEVFGTPAKEKVDNVIPFTSRNAKNAQEVMQSQPGANFAEGSWWQAFNAVTYMTDHLQGREGDSRLQSAWYGRNRKVKLNALEKALEYAEAA